MSGLKESKNTLTVHSLFFRFFPSLSSFTLISLFGLSVPLSLVHESDLANLTPHHFDVGQKQLSANTLACLKIEHCTRVPNTITYKKTM